MIADQHRFDQFGIEDDLRVRAEQIVGGRSVRKLARVFEAPERLPGVADDGPETGQGGLTLQGDAARHGRLPNSTPDYERPSMASAALSAERMAASMPEPWNA